MVESLQFNHHGRLTPYVKEGTAYRVEEAATTTPHAMRAI